MTQQAPEQARAALLGVQLAKGRQEEQRQREGTSDPMHLARVLGRECDELQGQEREADALQHLAAHEETETRSPYAVSKYTLGQRACSK